jgi:hypothetical protein
MKTSHDRLEFHSMTWSSAVLEWSLGICALFIISPLCEIQGQTGGGKAPANNFASSSMSGMSSRTSPLGNKTVAFSKPTNPGESTGAGSLTRMGPESTHRAGPRLRAEGLMVPPASDAATLRRQVAALQIDLEAHIDGEQRLQSINQQLRERFPHLLLPSVPSLICKSVLLRLQFCEIIKLRLLWVEEHK